MKKTKIAVCLPARGEPELLAKSLASIDKAVGDPENTEIIVGVDSDDELLAGMARPVTRCELNWCVAERELSVGEKYNRCAAQTRAELLTMWVDDCLMLTPDWDEGVRKAYADFDAAGDRACLLYGQQRPSPLPGFMTVSREYVNLVGYYCPTWFPNWWQETWIDEIGHLIGRILWVHNIATQPIGAQKTRQLREVGWWAMFFDETRPERYRTADRVSEAINPKWRVEQLIQSRLWLSQWFDHRNANLRTGDQAAYLEEHCMAATIDEERYRKAKARAAEHLKEVRRAPPKYRET